MVVFKKLLGAFGVGGPSVDTVLSNPNTRPGLSPVQDPSGVMASVTPVGAPRS